MPPPDSPMPRKQVNETERALVVRPNQSLTSPVRLLQAEKIAAEKAKVDGMMLVMRAVGRTNHIDVTRVSGYENCCRVS